MTRLSRSMHMALKHCSDVRVTKFYYEFPVKKRCAFTTVEELRAKLESTYPDGGYIARSDEVLLEVIRLTEADSKLALWEAVKRALLKVSDGNISRFYREAMWRV